MPTTVDTSESRAHALDARDPLTSLRGEFFLPDAAAVARTAGLAGQSTPSGTAVYLTGNSLGCQPRAVAQDLTHELEDWARLGVEGHLHARDPWLPYHEQFRSSLGRVVGGLPTEVVAMNSLTVNLHLLMASFYRPTRDRFKIMIEDSAFPSDSYAVQSQAGWHSHASGFDARQAIVRLTPREGEHTLRTDDILAAINREGASLALVMLGAVNYLSGQWFDMDTITRAGHAAGASVGWDLAHAAGNVPLRLHDIGADFAAWCSYKYLNAGPGAIAGAFVHERHHAADLPQFAGWWGNDPASRFRMGPEFHPVARADRWALSNPPIFALTPLKASLALFDRATMPALREKSVALTAYMEGLLKQLAPNVGVRTPADPAQRGCQLSMVVRGSSREVQQKLLTRGVVCDFREPDVIRAAPVPLYNSFHDVWRFATELGGMT
ncbi:MAG: kynureninase [Phycisphaerales bacterium]